MLRLLRNMNPVYDAKGIMHRHGGAICPHRTGIYCCCVLWLFPSGKTDGLGSFDKVSINTVSVCVVCVQYIHKGKWSDIFLCPCVTMCYFTISSLAKFGLQNYARIKNNIRNGISAFAWNFVRVYMLFAGSVSVLAFLQCSVLQSSLVWYNPFLSGAWKFPRSLFLSLTQKKGKNCPVHWGVSNNQVLWPPSGLWSAGQVSSTPGRPLNGLWVLI